MTRLFTDVEHSYLPFIYHPTRLQRFRPVELFHGRAGERAIRLTGLPTPPTTIPRRTQLFAVDSFLPP